MEPLLRLKNILLRQGGNFMLQVDSLSFQPQRIYALTGPNGAGKSSLLRIMALLSKPQQGELCFSHAENCSRAELRQRVTLVQQSPYLFDGSVTSNLAYGLKLRGVAIEEQRRRIELTLSVVGLKGFEERKARELSGGETQRVALARALVFKPQLLLLDEPTANIDIQGLLAFEAVLSRLPNYGITVVFTSHDLDQAKRLGHEILQIDNGQLLPPAKGSVQ